MNYLPTWDRAGLTTPPSTGLSAYEPVSKAFYVNIASPAQIVMIASGDPGSLQSTIEIGQYAADGEVTGGSASVNQAATTGERSIKILE